MRGRDAVPPPMPSSAEVAGTVRDVGSLELPVARVRFVDVTGDAREIDLTPVVAMGLVVDLSTFVRQCGVPASNSLIPLPPER